MHLVPCPVWEIVEDCKTLEGFCNKMVPKFSFHSKIPPEIEKRLKTIQELIIHSYYVYEFIDVAYLVTFQTLEFALAIKFQTHNPNNESKMTLYPYLEWAISKKIITLTHAEKDTLTYFRNRISHLKQDSISGLVALNPIRVVGNLICNIFLK